MIKKLALTIPGSSSDGVKIDPIKGMPGGGLDTFQSVITLSIQLFMIGSVLIALAFIIIGGIQIITSGGDKSGIDSGRKKVVFALVGLTVVFLSFFIIRVFGNIFGLDLLNMNIK